MVADAAEQLTARGIKVITGEVTGLEVTGDTLTGVLLRSGQVIPRRAVIIGPRFEARHPILDNLGVTITEHPLAIGRPDRNAGRGGNRRPGPLRRKG